MDLSVGISKHCQNDSVFFLLRSKMKSMQQWTINGSVISISEHKNHIRLYVKGYLTNPSYSTKAKIDCIVPERLYKLKLIDTTKDFCAMGHIVFENGRTFFLVERL